MITAQRILTELGNRAWSGFNADDMVFTSDDSAQARAELNCALRYLINLEDFPFKKSEKSIQTSTNLSNYKIPDGQITTIYNVDTQQHLYFIGDSTNYDKKATGTPVGFWVDYKNPNQKLRLYPTPDKLYNFNIVYNQYKPVLNAEGEMNYEFTKETDYINMPEKIDYLFMDCLVMRTMQQNNKDDQDENYKPMISEFNEMWRVFKKACKPVKIDNMVVW